MAFGMASDERASWAEGAESSSASSPSVPWRTGVDFQRQLTTSVGLFWRGQPLRDALAGLARNQRVAIFLDRRVDPGQEVEFTVRDRSLQEALQRLADDHNMGLGYVGPVVYLGPRRVTSKLATLVATRASQLAQLPNSLREPWLRHRSWQWPALAQPRQLIERLAREEQIEILGIEQVPHDLWPAADLPPLTLGQRLTLVAAGFDLTFEPLRDGRTVRLVPIPESVALRRVYRVPRDAAQIAQKLARLCPDARVVSGQQQVVVEGSSEEHAKVQAFLISQPADPPARGAGEKRYSLRVVNQRAQKVLDRLAAELRLTIHADPAAARKLDQLVTFHVEDSSLSQLLDAALEPLGLTYQLKGSQLIVRGPVGNHAE
jgi:hypothetical protein